MTKNRSLLALTACLLALSPACAFRFNHPVSGTNFSSNASSSGGTPPPALVQGTVNVAPVYPNHGANWMDYVANSGGGGQAWNRPDTACAGTEAGYFKCLHGGEYRAFQATGQTSCTGLTASDSLGAFNWVCDASTSPVTFRSRGLKYGKGLRDLINASGTAFAANSVTVHDSASYPVFETPSSIWWSNTFAALPGGNTTLASLSAGTIYVAASNVSTQGYSVSSQDKVAVVTMPGVTVTWNNNGAQCANDGTATGGGSAMICLGGTGSSAPTRFLWIEAKIDGHGGGGNVGCVVSLGDYVRMSRIHRSDISGGESVCDDGVNPSNAILVDQSWLHDDNTPGAFPDNGAYLTVSTYVTLMNSSFTSFQSQSGIRSNGANNTVIYQDLTANNTNDGVKIEGGSANVTVVGVTSFDNAYTGVHSFSTGDFLGVTALNNGGGNGDIGQVDLQGAGSTGSNLVAIGGGSTNSLVGLEAHANNQTWQDLLAAYQVSNGIYYDGASTTYNGRIWVGQNGVSNCTLGGGSGPWGSNDNNCTHGGATTTGIDPVASGSFEFGALPTADSANTTPSFTSPMAFGSITDFVDFINPFRAWAYTSGAANPFSGNNGNFQCVAGKNCQVYDFALSSSDTLMRGIYGTWPNNGSCPTSVDPTQAINVISGSSSHFLVAAWEILDPWANPNGNFNGLCESGETCVFTPNLGSYQGTGDPLTTTPCTTGTGNGITSAITLYGFPNP